VNAIAATGNLPVLELLWRSIQQAWIPNQWHADCPAIHKGYAQGVFRNVYICNPFVSRYYRRSHATPPKVRLDVLPPSVEFASTQVAESHDYVLSLLDPTKIWQRDYHDLREYAVAHLVRDPKNKSGMGRCVKLSA
jgi:hypothetical protein